MMAGMSPQPARQKIIVAAVVAAFLSLPIALTALGGWNMWKDSRAGDAGQGGAGGALRESLERAADVAFPAPTLGGEALTVECKPENFEKEVQRVVRLAGGAGGSASSWNDGVSVRIVANVPGGAEHLFRESVANGTYDLSTAGDSASGSSAMVEVLIRPAE